MNTITSCDGPRAYLALMIPLVKILEQAAVAVSGRVHHTAALAGDSGVTLHRLSHVLMPERSNELRDQACGIFEYHKCQLKHIMSGISLLSHVFPLHPSLKMPRTT